MTDVEKARAAYAAVMAKNRRFLWMWLATSAVASTMGNIGHVWQEAEVAAHATATTVSVVSVSLWLAIIWAVVPPLMLMLAVHGLPVLQQMLGRESSDIILKSVVWGVTGGAFLWSGFGIFSFTVGVGVPAQVAWLAPVVIDLSVFGATRGLVQTAPVVARLAEGIVEPMERLDQREAATHDPHEAPHEAAVERVTAHDDAPREASVERPTARRDAAVKRPVKRAVAQTASLTLTHDAAQIAQRIVDQTPISQPAEVIEKVLELAMSGSSQREIGSTKIVSASTAGRIINAARELDAAEPVPEREPALTAVG